MAHLFQPDRSLLYPQFETYKLHSLDVDEDTAGYKLPGNGATQSRVGYNQHHLSFKEVRSRIGWDHLSVGSSGRAMYIDTDWKVIGIQLDADLRPEFSELASLPIPVSSKEQTQEPEYPSAAQLDDTHWAVSTGSGTIYILETSRPSEPLSGKLIARYDMERQSTSPFLLRTAHLASQREAKLLLSRTTPSTERQRTQDKTFDLLEVSIDPAQHNGLDEDPALLATTWSLTSGDLPHWTAWWDQGWLVLSGEEYRTAAAAAESRAATASTTTLSRSGIGAGPIDPDADVAVPTQSSQPDTSDEREWPFSWTQTTESISMVFNLPAGTKRTDFNVELRKEDWDISVNDTVPSLSPVLQDFFKTRNRYWYSEIDPDLSTFTFNPDKAVLELELVKAHDLSRWPSIFLPTEWGTGDDSDDDMQEEVPETLDAKTLAAVRETFNNIKTRGSEEPEGQHPAIPALLREEMEIDLDDDEDYDQPEGPYGDSGSKVGRDCFIGYILDGKSKWTRTTTNFLSLPMPSGDTESKAGFIVKSAVDGLTYSPEEGADPSQTAWKHLSTSPALAFVLSSKRDLRLVRHIDTSLKVFDNTPPDAKRARTETSAGTTVLAFDAGSYGGQAQGNVYVYYPPSSKTVAKQGVVGISGRDRGALLGVGAVKVGEKNVVLALCEKELVVLSGVV